jgi:hypothetical protein
MSIARWSPPPGHVLARSYFRPEFLLNPRTGVVHAVGCHSIVNAPLARMLTVRLDALPRGVRCCSTCIAPPLQTSRREPARVDVVQRRDPLRAEDER